MARVSQEHLDARRRQILDGARRCFTRNGFHATSVQDVLKETGLSAGAVYRYFKGKDELVAAVAAEALETVREGFAAAREADPPPAPDVLFGVIFGRLRKAMGADETHRELPQLLLQVWGETLRNEELASVLAKAYALLREQWTGLFRAYQERGWVDPEANPEHVARTLIGAVQGYFVQQALFGRLEPEDFQAGLRALTSMRIPPGSRDGGGPGSGSDVG